MLTVKLGSIESLKSRVSTFLGRNDVNGALRLIHNFVERIITEPLCTSQVLGSRALDDLCQEAGRICFSGVKRRLQSNEAGPDKQGDLFIYVVTKLQKSGGHTRVIEDFVAARPQSQHVILSSELEGSSDSDYVAHTFSKRAGFRFESAPKGNYELRLRWLQERLIELQPKRVYLFNHHGDSVAVAAVQPAMGINVSFYHHGDHHLCLGVFLPDVEHIDPHPMGYHLCRESLGIENVYIPLTVPDRGARPPEWLFQTNGGLTTCTAGRSNKVEIPYFVSYVELVPELLKVTGGTHVHIGRLSPWALYKIGQGLKRAGIPAYRFVYTPWVASVWEALHDYRVDLYIASFPYGGGLTLLEAMGAGVPVALHRHIFSRVLSGIELGYPGAFSWRFPKELLDYCSSLSPEALETAGRSGRMQYEKLHCSSFLARILNNGELVTPRPGGLSSDFSVQHDEWAAWMEQQVSLRRVLSRVAYRTFRRLRRVFP